MAQVYGAPLAGDPFHDRRRTGVGGSDAAAILGLSPFNSRLGVWEDKRGLRPPAVGSERMLWGQRLEEAVLRGYAEDTSTAVTRGRFRRHPRYPFVIGHPDAEGIRDGAPRLVEVKVTSRLDDRWGPEGSEQVPVHFYAQVQHYMLLRDLPVADLTALVGGREARTYTLPRNEAFIEALLDEEARFWQEVVTGTPPEPDGSEDAAAALRLLYPKATADEVVATTEVAGYAERYLAAREAVEAAERDRDRWAQAMQRYMGARGVLVGPGFRATWGNRAGSTKWKSVAEELLGSAVLFNEAVQPGSGEAVRREFDGMVERYRGEATRVFSLTKTEASDG